MIKRRPYLIRLWLNYCGYRAILGRRASLRASLALNGWPYKG
jgi:hypothetical protein